jgi:predicted glycosyltransferase
VETLRRTRPDVAITELFPFGRRALAEEFEAGLAALKDVPRPPLVFASVRDVLAPPSSEKKALRTRTMLDRFYDGVLVHSDPAVIPLETSWPVTPDIAAMLRYTGFIAAAGDDEPGREEPGGEILVTAGGGPVGRRLFETAIGAARLTGAMPWRLLVGGADAAAQCERLAMLAQGLPVTVEPVRADYRALLRHCAAAVGHCGYNTAIDWMRAGVPGVFVPFAEGGEMEQTIRARLLAARFGFSLVEDAALSPQTLADAVRHALRTGRPTVDGIDLDGAAESGRLVLEALRERE